MGKHLDLDDVAAGHPVALRELEELRQALRIIYTWAGVEGFLVPEHVRDLAGDALGIEEGQE